MEVSTTAMKFGALGSNGRRKSEICVAPSRKRSGMEINMKFASEKNDTQELLEYLYDRKTVTIPPALWETLPYNGMITHNLGTDSSWHTELVVPVNGIYFSFDSIHKTFDYVPLFNNNLLYFIQVLAEASFNRPMHFHNFIEISIVLSGSVTVQIEDQTEKLYMGDIFISNPYVLHNEQYTENFQMLSLMITKKYLWEILNQDDDPLLFKNRFVLQLFSSQKYSITFHPKEMNGKVPFEVASILMLALREMIERRLGSSHLLAGAFCRLFLLLDSSNYYTFMEHWLKSAKQKEVLFFDICYTLEKYHGKVTNSFLEEKFNYNSEYMNRIVKQNSGLTLTEYKRIFLLDEAARLLADTDMVIADICKEMGYANRSFFNKIFIKRYGVSPEQYRSQHKEKRFYMDK